MLYGNTQLLTSYENRTECDLNVISKRLMDLECIKWVENLANKPKLRTYRTFKSEFEQEKYLKMTLSRTERSYLAQLRFWDLL